MKISGAVTERNLVPEEVIFGLLSKRLEEGYCRGESGFILDGIPRTKLQAVCKALSFHLALSLGLVYTLCVLLIFSVYFNLL